MYLTYLRSLAITVALALGLLLILAMAFIMCIPAYGLNLLNVVLPHPPRPRVL